MKIREAVSRIDELYKTRVEIEGYMYVTSAFSYMQLSDNFDDKDEKYVLIMDGRIYTFLNDSKVSCYIGTPVLYGGQTKLIARLYNNSGFPMFSAFICDVSEMTFDYREQQQLYTKFFDPLKNLYLKGGKPLNNEQVQIIKHIVKGSDNFIAVKKKFSQEGNHLLAFYLDESALTQLQQQLRQVGITDYFWLYSENNFDAFETAGYGYLYH